MNLKILLGVFALLLALVVAKTIYDSEKGEKTFKSDLATIDTANVTSISFYPKVEKKGIRFNKQNKIWTVSGNGKEYTSDNKIIESILNSIAVIKAERVAATEKNMWKDFEITDTAGTKVIVEVSNKKAIEFTIGKFSYKQMGQGFSISSYIRLAGENEVYSVQSQLSMLFNRDLNSYRNKIIIKANASDFTKLTFSYPCDSSFVMSNDNNKWKINGEDTDSAKVSNYLNTIANLSGYNFTDEKAGIAKSPVYKLLIDGKNMPLTEINAFPSDSINKFIIVSSLNKDAYFISGNAKIAERIFEGMNRFLIKK